jgi:hypothetical protein
VAAGDEAGPAGEGRQDQEHGGDLPALTAHQGVPDCRLLPAEAEGRGYEGLFYFFVFYVFYCTIEYTFGIQFFFLSKSPLFLLFPSIFMYYSYFILSLSLFSFSLARRLGRFAGRSLCLLATKMLVA